MKGYIYIASCYKTIEIRSDSKEFIDNDPHFWTFPPTWGICRTEFRKNVNSGDYVFFVLPKYSVLGQENQMIFGYLKVKRIISHFEAYLEYPEKRMLRNERINGNIIVDKNGNYNIYDRGAHKSRFNEIKQYYVVGEQKSSKFLTEEKVMRLAPQFTKSLNIIFNTEDKNIFEIISRKGRKLDENKIIKLLDFLEL